MYCPTCGAGSTQGLRYCKQCGGSLSLVSRGEPELATPKLSGLYWAIAAITIGGLGLLSGTMLGLVALGIQDGDVLVMMVIFGCMTIFGVVSMLVRQLSRFMTLGEAKRRRSAKNKEEVREREVPRIPETPFLAPSVTEHTTRQFEEVQSRTSE